MAAAGGAGPRRIVAGRIIVAGGRGVLRTRAKPQALAVLDQEPEQAVAALADDLQRARAQGAAGRVQQPVAPRKIEEPLRACSSMRSTSLIASARGSPRSTQA